MQRFLFEDARVQRKPECVYAIRDEATGRIKIGRTKSLPNRIASLKTGWSSGHEVILELSTTDSRALEAVIHRMWASYRVQGEWFSFPEIMQHWIAHMRCGGTLDSWRLHVLNIPRSRRPAA